MLPELPLELYREIFKHLDRRKDLLTLTLTSQSFQREVEFIIYNTIECKSQLTAHLICNAILSNPRIRYHIRSFDMTLITSVCYSPPLAFWLVFARALRTLHVLDVLRIDLGDGATLNAWVLMGCSFQLTEFESNFVMDNFLISFLRTQSNLRKIDWQSPSNDLSSFQLLQSSTTVPSLSELTTNSTDLVCSVVAHRPITHLWLQGVIFGRGLERWTEIVPTLGLSSGPICSLRISFPHSHSATIQVLLSLKVHTPELRSLGFLPSFTIEEKGLINAIAEFKQLKSVVLRNVICADASRMLAEACPSLRLIACLHYSYSHEYVCLPVNPSDRPVPMHDPSYRLWRDVWIF